MTSKRFGHLGAAISIAVLLTALPVPASAAVLLHDFFGDDTAGAAPNGPAIGTAGYGGCCGQGGANAAYTVIDSAGNLKLRIDSPGPANDPANGSIIEYFPTVQPGAAKVSYEFRVARGGLAQAALNSFAQELVFDPLGLNLELLWSSDGDGHHLWYGISVPGQGTFTLTDTGFVYALDTAYAIEWLIDANTDRFSLSADGTALASNVPFGADGTSLRELAFVNNFATTGTQVIDNVLIEAVPEPSTAALAALGLIGLWSARRRPSR
jgi:hypothetical protein